LTGKICINDKADSILYSQTDNKYTKYKGKLLGVFSNGVLSVQNQKYLVRALSKKSAALRQ